MTAFKDFTKLDVWQKAQSLANNIYSTTKQFPKEELFGLSSQMGRVGISIPSNIAEGIRRSHSKETIHFLEIAKGSLFELKTQVYVAYDQKYMNENELI